MQLSGSFAQDLHFAQMNQNPALLNPALTGASGGYRGSLNYRTQWASVTTPYKTFGASAELRFNPDNWEQVNKFQSMTFKEKLTGRLGAGISVYNDVAGDGKMGVTLSSLSLASFIPVGKSEFISIGLQAGLGQRRLITSNLVFPDQYNGSRYDAAKPTREKRANDTYIYPDFAAGALWTTSRSDREIGSNRQLKTKVGIAAYHLAEPPVEFLRTAGKLERRYVAFGEILKDINNTNMAYEASLTFQYSKPSQEFLAGFIMRYYLNGDSKYTGYVKRNCIGFGAYYRSMDAIIPCMLIDLKDQYTISMSYDVNVSQLAGASTLRGGFELSLRVRPARAFLYEMRAPGS
jgi:type IX secretion system PorP/SprF family membrane protein